MVSIRPNIRKVRWAEGCYRPTLALRSPDLDARFLPGHYHPHGGMIEADLLTCLLQRTQGTLLMRDDQNNQAIIKPLPGDLAMWVFICAELAVFGLMIIGFSVARSISGEGFQESHDLLDTSTGLALTVSLLTSGFFTASAVNLVRSSRQRLAGMFLVTAILFSFIYVYFKIREYNHLDSLGLDINYDTFFTLYWILTGFHFLHVILGIVILAYMSVRCWKSSYAKKYHGLESGALYWHMVDLVWVMLFPLFYALG